MNYSRVIENETDNLIIKKIVSIFNLKEILKTFIKKLFYIKKLKILIYIAI